MMIPRRALNSLESAKPDSGHYRHGHGPDEVGPRVSGDGAAADTEQQIYVGSFHSTFIRPERGTANVVAEVEMDGVDDLLNVAIVKMRSLKASR